MHGRSAHFCAAAIGLLLSACSGSTGEQVLSTPVPASGPTAGPITVTPGTQPAGEIDFDTAEYRASNGPAFHGAMTAYEAGASGSGVLVGIVDSGITDAAGEFTGRISGLSRDFGGNGSVADVGGHGTAVAEVLAGARNGNHVQGMAFGATILALRTDKPGTCNGSGCDHSTTAMTQAIDYAWRSGARVINVSLGGDMSSPELVAAVSRATAAGTIIVVSAGNTEPGSPRATSPDVLAASFANSSVSHGLVIIATSVDADGTISSFSNGAGSYTQVTLSALGDHVQTIDHNGTDLLYTGTSFSAPQISGAIALLAEAFPNLSSAQIVDLLKKTARDAGAAGPDALYGMGILDVDRAFRPQGQLTLAGTEVLISPGDPTTLSTAMGDAHPAGLSAVALDAYQRPYETDLSGGLTRRGMANGLTSRIAGATRSWTGQAGPLSLSLQMTPGRLGFADRPGMQADPAVNRPARLVTGTMSAALSPRAAVAFGLRTGLADLTRMIDGQSTPAFLMAQAGSSAQAQEFRPDASLAWRHQLGSHVSMIGGMESGDVDGRFNRPGVPGLAPGDRRARYQSVATQLTARHGAVGLTGGLTLMREEGSTLGARFSRTLGAQSATSLQASVGLRIEPASGFALAASYQQGWTHAAAGGTLADGGTLTTRSWSLDLAKSSIFSGSDMIGLRVSAPLRVTSSRFALSLPQGWDWRSETATVNHVALDLVPGGSERDYELSYGLGVSGGWIGANLFLRTQSGNVAAMPDDAGIALRWTARF